ncbi:LamG domain-containing protein [Actinokineospora inagensis]|uniref:LamG domain-containing protein n=1 Tax=Actinokineospora inagensis TaxID=103730 RepID=UPI000405DE72|nr:LamG domain-containing protein [Actinokineospora inagensis]
MRGRYGTRRTVWTAALLVVFLVVPVAVSPGAADQLGRSGWPGWSSALAWLVPGSASADPLDTPKQVTGTAAGLDHYVPTDATRAKLDEKKLAAKTKQVKSAGDSAAYEPPADKRKQHTTPVGPKAAHFDPKTSKPVSAGSTPKHQVFANADGSRTDKDYPTPRKQANAAEAPADADTTLQAGPDGRLRPRKSGITVEIAPTANDPALVTVGTGPRESVSYSLTGARAAKASTDDPSTVDFAEVLPATDLTLDSTPAGVKESLVLRTRAATNSWTFPLTTTGLTPRLANGAVDFVDAAGKVELRIPRGTMHDTRQDGVAESSAITYELVKTGATTSLKVTADKKWLSDPARVYPVVVDPSMGAIFANSSTWVASPEVGDQSSSMTMNIGSNTESLVSFDQVTTAFPGQRLTAVTLNVFVVYSVTCAAKPMQVSLVNSYWSPNSVTWATRPTLGAQVGQVNVATATACANTSQNINDGQWVQITLDPNQIRWNGGTQVNWGLAITTDAGSTGKKVLASSNAGVRQAYLTMDWVADEAPVITDMWPANAYAAPTLTPTLSVSGYDPDNWPGPLSYLWRVYDTSNNVVDEVVTLPDPNSTQSSHTIAPGVLKWNRTYLWTAIANDGYRDQPADEVEFKSFTTTIPQPAVSRSLGANQDGRGYDPVVGNFMSAATDAEVSTVGPSLSVQRTYNSVDTRLDNAFGLGWSSLYDSRVTEQRVGTTIMTVTVADANGQQIVFGRNPDGTLVSPPGRSATLFSLPAGGYRMVDDKDTTRLYGKQLSTGFGLTSIVDAASRELTFTYSGTRLASLTGASGRSLTLTWTTPSGALRPHIDTVSTDPVNPNVPGSALVWHYAYSGDKLTDACPPGVTVPAPGTPPGTATGCTHYGYTATTQYPSAVLDNSPTNYWRLGETSGTTAGDSVVLNQNTTNGTYNSVAFNQPGGIAGSTARSVGFNGLTGSVTLPNTLYDEPDNRSISLWFKADYARPGVLLSYNGQSVTANSSSTESYLPVLYMGSSGKIYATPYQDGQNTPSPVVTAGSLADGQWHNVVLSNTHDSYTLFVDGGQVGTQTKTRSVTIDALRYTYVGAGFLGWQWPDQPNPSTSYQGVRSTFTGSISDVAYFNHVLDPAAVTKLADTGRTVANSMTTVNKPGGGAYSFTSYDPAGGRVSSVVDSAGGNWSVGNPTVTGSSQVYAGAVLGAAPRDYWRLADMAGTTPRNEVNGGAAEYQSVTLGGPGPFSDRTAASFNGTSSALDLSRTYVVGTKGSGASQTISMWFRTSARNGVLFSYQAQAVTPGATSSANYTPALYVGNDGKLQGKFWDGNATTMSSPNAVDDGLWHHVVLTAGAGSQGLYLDGVSVGSRGGTVDPVDLSSTVVTLVGAGFLGGTWPDQNRSGTGGSATATFFSGSISDVAYFPSSVNADKIKAIWQAGQRATGTSPVLSVTVTDPTGKALVQTHDPRMGNRMLSRADALGNATRYGYDESGNLQTVVDPNGNTTVTTHNASNGQTSSVTTCQSIQLQHCSTTYYSYTSAAAGDPQYGLVASTRDGRTTGPTDNRYKTTFGYDAFGNQTSVQTPPVAGFPNGRTMTFEYTAQGANGVDPPPGLPTKTTTPGGSVQTALYTAAGDVYSSTDAAGVVTDYEYDNLGRMTARHVVADGVERTSRYEYNNLGLVSVQTDPGVRDRVSGVTHTARATTGYDLDGNATIQTVDDITGGDTSRVVHSTYNPRGQLTGVTDATNASWTYEYDVYGNKSKDTDPAGNVVRYAYDPNHKLLTQTLVGYRGDPNNPGTPTDLVESSRAYDPAGRLASITDSMGRRTRYTYYDDGKVFQVIRVGPNTSEMGLEMDSYDGAGHLTGQSKDNGATSVLYEIDAAGRTAAVTDPDGIRRTAYEFSADDKITKQTTTGAGKTRVTSATYDPSGLALTQTVSTATGPVTTTTVRNQLGLPTTVTDPLGRVTTYSYDDAGKVFSVLAPQVQVENGVDAPGATQPNSKYGYSTFGEQVEEVNPNGGVTRTAYDAGGRVTSVRAPGTSTATKTNAYNGLGQLTEVKDSFGKATTYSYTQLGDLSKVVARDGGVTTYTYDTNGERLSTTDPTGAVTQATYNHLGKPLTATEVIRQPTPHAATTTFDYNDYNQVRGVASPGSGSTTYEYDTLGQVAWQIDPTGFMTSFSYDHLGRPFRAYQADGLTSETTFDDLGNATSVKKTKNGATLNEVKATYDKGSRLLTQTDAAGATTTYSYDDLDRLTQTVQPVTSTSSITSSYGYDNSGNLTRFTDGRGGVFKTVYNAWNLPRQIVEPATTQYPNATDRTFTASYDFNGRLTGRTSPGGVSTSFTYDDMDRVTKQTGTGAAAGTIDRTFGYDLAGRVTSASAPGGTTNNYTYDDRGMVLTTAGPGGTAGFAYDNGGRLTQRTDAAGTANYGYDSSGRLHTASDPLTGAQLTYDYGQASLLSKITYGTGGNVRTFGYDDLRQLTSDVVKTAGGAQVASIAYGYNGNGDMTSKNTTGAAGASNNTYTYDQARRLTSWTTGSTTTNYGYDASGNRTQAGSKTFTYNARNQLLNDGTSDYAYTARGTLSGITTAGNTTQITSNAFDEEITRGVQTYTYDAFGRVNTATTMGQSARQMVYSGTGNSVVSDGTALYSRGPGDDLLGVKQGGRSELAYTDQHDDVIGTFSAAGSSLGGSTSYDPWGAKTASSTPIGNLGFQSGWTEQGNGQVNMGTRWYSPGIGQFTTRDTADNSPVPTPIAGHRYAYLGNNPLNGTDTSGTCGGFWGWACDAWDGVTSAADTAWNATTDAASWAWNTASDAASWAWNTASDAVNWAWNGVKTAAVAVGHAAVAVGHAVSDAAKWLGRQVAAGAKAVGNAAKGVGQAVAKVAGKVYDAGATAAKAAAGAVRHAVTTVADQIDDLYQTGRAAVVEAYHELQSVAQKTLETVTQFAADVVDTVRVGVATAYNAAQTAVTSATQWVENHAPAIVDFVVSTAVFLGCEAVIGIPTAGIGAVAGAAGCGALAGAAGGAAAYGVQAAQSGQFSWSDLGMAALTGGGVGAVMGPLGYAGGKVLGYAAKAAAGAFGRGTAEATASDAVRAATDTGGGKAAAGSGRTAADTAGTPKPSGSSGRPPSESSSSGCHSFDGATRVLMAGGLTKPIKDIHVGDRVVAADPGTGEQGEHTVTALHVNNDLDLADVTVRGSDGAEAVVHTTAGHQFWDATTHTWQDAVDLATGDDLATADGSKTVVTGVTTHTGPRTSYDLTVDVVHTYYVLAGLVPVLGHNCGSDFTDVEREKVYAANAEANGGVYKCEYCGKEVTRRPSEKGVPGQHDDAQIDHVVPKSQGGLGVASNGAVSCRSCNRSKGPLTMGEWDTKIIRTLGDFGIKIRVR